MLNVDDFGIQYMAMQHAQHLIAVLKQDYKAVTTDWDSKLFCGIHLDWDYQACTVDLSMPGCVQRVPTDFAHPPLSCPEHQPHHHNEPQYSTKLQLMDPTDTTQPLTTAQNLELQKFLYYARAVNPTMLVTLSALVPQQTKGMARTAPDAVKFLNYCATHPDASIRYTQSDMILCCHSDASYLSKSQAPSQVGDSSTWNS
jgi:hypothetical protein